MGVSDSDRKDRHRRRKDRDDNEDDGESSVVRHERKHDRKTSHRKRDDRRRRDGDDGDGNGDDGDANASVERTRDRKSRGKREDHKRKQRKQESDDEDDDVQDSDSEGVDLKHRRRKKSSSSRRRRRRHKKSSSSKRKKKRSKRSSDDDSSSSSSSGSSDGSSDDDDDAANKKVVNEKLLAKLNARGETLDERKERRGQKRAAKIEARFGYTAEENPFNDPNLHETFTWTKKKEKAPGDKETADSLAEIENIRLRRKERDAERDEMDRIRAEEVRMKELENYDDWAKKEEEFHLEQQRKRSAIRLVEGREKPIDILAKNLLLFGLSDEEKKSRAAVKYKERYNALEQLEKLEAELEEPQKIVKVLKLAELKELLTDIDAFRMLETQSMDSDSKSSILLYWDALYRVTQNEIKILQQGGKDSPFAQKIEGINEIFQGQSQKALIKMKAEVEEKLRKSHHGAEAGNIDRTYWLSVQEQLIVYLAMMDLKELHSKMLVRQLERLEQRKEELKDQTKDGSDAKDEKSSTDEVPASMMPKDVSADFGNGEEEIGEGDEVDVVAGKSYTWQDKYKPRKPRYFNRVKTGYDWNKYNQTHYDSENPPPKTVQGYKFNIFYPDLVDPTKTPKYYLEPADADDFCILRFHAGAPYEDVAFKIINREWNRSRKRGFRCTFERGVLSLYFNFTTHWYRR
jgi:hypothetical protein